MSSATRRPRSSGWQRSSVPWMTSTGHCTCRQSSSAAVRDSARRVPLVRRSSPRPRCRGPTTTVSSILLRRVRLRELLVEEELDPRRGSRRRDARTCGCACPIRSASRIAPASSARARPCSRAQARPRCRARWRRARPPGRDDRAASRSAHGVAWQWATTTARVTPAASRTATHVGLDLVGSVALTPVRPVRPAGAAPVGRDDGEVAGQERDQPLPRPGVGDR